MECVEKRIVIKAKRKRINECKGGKAEKKTNGAIEHMINQQRRKKGKKSIFLNIVDIDYLSTVFYLLFHWILLHWFNFHFDSTSSCMCKINLNNTTLTLHITNKFSVLTCGSGSLSLFSSSSSSSLDSSAVRNHSMN